MWWRLLLCSSSGTMQPGGGSALARARALKAALPSAANTSTTGGEFERAHWWDEHGDLFEEARREYGPLHPQLYELQAHEADYLDGGLVAAVRDAEEQAAAGGDVDEAGVLALLSPTDAPGVHRLRVFTPLFCTHLLEELRHYEASGIPLRRPNGMNRFGAILDQLGMHASLEYLSRRYVRPLGQMLFPWLISSGDADEHYAFAVKYKRGEDTE